MIYDCDMLTGDCTCSEKPYIIQLHNIYNICHPNPSLCPCICHALDELPPVSSFFIWIHLQGQDLAPVI
eukprot:COSAG06_NODE_612_length_13800_cov_14.100650_14_plen_69_part_00